MLRALSTAATGMISQQNYLDVIANNIANVNTSGFKKSRVEFQDMLSQIVKTPGAMINQGTYQPVGVDYGLGVKTAATTRVFSQGTAISTDRNLDIAIQGEGFLQVMKTDGTLAYTRDGSLKVDSMGQLCTTDGYLIQPQTTIPSDAKEINITEDGNISVAVGSDTTQSIVGSIQLARFQNPSGLLAIGHNLFVETSASGNPIQDTPGSNGMGTIQQGFLEGSNVQIVSELIGLIQAQRAFESNSKLISASSDILKETNRMV
ncbi:MAG: flagellar basal-body rod protein FlgG [Candidatus Gastranaerophilales bacterium]|nr:flagellar basal-body rod protein FlgG [Candidatus Gastranaerophilales bacterium]